MIELIFITCLTVSPDACQERNMVFYDIAPMTCMMGAQSVLAEWSEQYPGHAISRWHCRVPRPGEKKI